MTQPLLGEGEDVTAMFSVPSVEDGEDVTAMFSVPSVEDGEDVTAMFSVPSVEDGEDVTSQFNPSAKPAEPTSNVLANMGRSVLGGVASSVAEIVGGAAGLLAMPGRSDAEDIAEFETKSAAISAKPSVFKDFTEEQIIGMQAAPEGYRTPQEEVQLTSYDSMLKTLRERQVKNAPIQQGLEDFQKLSSEASKEAQTFFGQDPARQDEFLSKLATGAGSLPPYIASSIAGGPVASMMIGALQTGQNEYNAAIEAGKPELADEAMVKGMGIGLTEGAGVGGGQGKAAKGFAAKALVTLKKAFEEGGQEWVQKTLSNLNASTFTGYEPERPAFKGSGEALAIGTILGGGVEGVGQSIRKDPVLSAVAPSTAAAVARTQPVTVTVPEVTTPTLPSGSLGPPDPIVVEAEAAGAPQTAAALNQTMPPKPFAPRIEEPGTPTPYGRETDVFDVTAGLERKPLAAPAPEPPAKPAAAVAVGAPILTSSRWHGDSTISLAFDATGKIPTPKELEDMFAKQGHKVSVTKLHGITSATTGTVKFRVNAYEDTPTGNVRDSKQAAGLAYKAMTGSDAPISSQSALQRAAPLQERFTAVWKYGAKAMGLKGKATPAMPVAPALEPVAKAMTRSEINERIAVLLKAPAKTGGKPRVSFKTQAEEASFRRGFEAANKKPGDSPPEQRPGVPAKEQKIYDAFSQGWSQAQIAIRSLSQPTIAPAPAAQAPVAPATPAAATPASEALTGKPWTGTVSRGIREKDTKTDAGDYGGNAEYWTGDKERAAAYSRPVVGTKGLTGEVVESEVSLKKPLVFKTTEEAREYRRSVVGDKLLDNPQSKEAASLIEADIRNRGFDGVVVYDSNGNFTADPSRPFEVVKLKPAPAPPAKPAAVVAVRDASKPEQMTPEEATANITPSSSRVTATASIKHARRMVSDFAGFALNKPFKEGIADIERVVSDLSGQKAVLQKVSDGKATLPEFLEEKRLYWESQNVKQISQEEWAEKYGIPQTDQLIKNQGYAKKALADLEKAERQVHKKKVEELLRSDEVPVSAAAVDTYGIKLTDGYVREGELYVHREKPPVSVSSEAKTMRRKLDAGESGGIPASLFQDVADFGARIYRAGMDFAAWSKEMVRHLGERVRSALKELWVGMLNPKGARNLRGEVIQSRDQGGAIGAAGGRAEPKPGATVEGGREGEYYTRVAERNQGTLSDNAMQVVRNRTTLRDDFKADLDFAAQMLLETKDGDLRAALDRFKEMRPSGINDYFSGLTDRRKAALLFIIQQNAATQRETATDPKQIAALKDIEAEAIADFSDLMSQGGKLLNIAGQLYAAMPMSPDAQVMAAEKLLARMTGGRAAEVEAAQAKDTLKTALDEQLKGMNESIRDIMRTKPKSSWDEIRQRIADEVVAKMNLATEAERKAATDKIIADLKKRMEKVRKKLLAKMSKPGKPGNKTALDKLWKLWELGALDDDALTKVFMEKAGVKEFTPDFKDKLKKMYEDAESAPEGMPRDRILGNIAVELALANPKTFSFWWNLAMSISYGNILGAFTTIFVNNPLGSLATSLEMVVMGSLSNKGARAETFKGAVKTWARSFGDGVAMMRDLWSTGENLQKISQFDSALVNSPVELLAKMAEDPSYPKSFRVAAKAVSQYKWIMRSMMAADAVIRWPAREALRFTQSAAIAKDTRRPGQSLEDAVDELNYPGGRPAAFREARTQAAKERKDGTLKTKLDERLRVIQLLQSKLSSEGTEAATESDELANYGSLLNDQPQDFIGVIASTILKIAFPSNTKSDLQKALGGAAQPFVRFVRTSANATRVMLDYSIGYGAFRYMTRNWPGIGAESLAGGANLIQPGGRHKMSKEAAIRAGDRLTQVRIQRAYLGIALYAGLAAIYAAIDDDDEDPYIDFIGSGPTTPDERRRVRESGVRLNSIKIGNTYVPTNVGPLQPLSGIFAPFQRMRDNKKYPKGTSDIVGEKVPEMAGVAVAKGIADAVMNQSFTRSLADVLTIIHTGKTSFGETTSEFLGKNVAQFVPGNLRGLSQLDEIVRGKKERADGFFDTATNAIAFYAPNGRATTILGDEVDAGKSVAQKAGEKVFQFTTLADDKTLQFVVKNGMSIPDRQPKPSNGKRQTYLEYSAYMRESGKMMRNWLETKNSKTGKTGMEMLQSIPEEVPGEKGKPINLRKKEINKLWSEFRQVALLKQ